MQIRTKLWLSILVSSILILVLLGSLAAFFRVTEDAVRKTVWLDDMVHAAEEIQLLGTEYTYVPRDRHDDQFDILIGRIDSLFEKRPHGLDTAELERSFDVLRKRFNALRAFNRFLEQPEEDTGIGIEPDQIEGIFMPFFQVDSSHSWLHQGTGLGLALVKRFVKEMGGNIEVESEPGKGSRFNVTIPLTIVGETEASQG